MQKLPLKKFDDKRSILEDAVATLPHGHYFIPVFRVPQDIADDTD